MSEVACNQSFYYAGAKAVWRENNATYLLFKLNSDHHQAKQLTAYEEDCPIVKVSIQELKTDLQAIIQANGEGKDYVSARLHAVESLENYLAGTGAETGK